MSLAITKTRASIGMQAPSVTVETHLSAGLPGLSIVGLPETVVKESRDRVRSALLNSQFEFPARRITINLAPADLPKQGSRFDLAIALGILAASKQIPSDVLDDYEFVGELALSGKLRPVPSILPFALAAYKAKHKVILPVGNALEASLSRDTIILPAESILEICAHMHGKKQLQPYALENKPPEIKILVDFAEIHGQSHAKRALEIAASGKHSLLLRGPPGTGKTMLATRFTSILPPLTDDEALEVATVHSASGKIFGLHHWTSPPFRSPHHTASSAALVGGGNPPKPGEISLAHHGVLFLDELPEFKCHVLESLREPLESGAITLSRAARQAEFPARFQLIAAMNPCPCGYLGSTEKYCQCSEDRIRRYYGKLSGPLLDRIDMQVEVPLPRRILSFGHKEEADHSKTIRERVIRTRDRQLRHRSQLNSSLFGKTLEVSCAISRKDRVLLETACKKFRLSMRAYHRILRISRTIADMSECERVEHSHLMEALSYRHCLHPPPSTEHGPDTYGGYLEANQ